MSKGLIRLSLTGVLLSFLMLAQSPPGATPRQNGLIVGHEHAPMIVHERHGSQVTSANWSGYAVTGAPGSVTDVKGSWRVPALLSCGSTDSYSSFWVGIDGYSSNTVEQTGTDSDCLNGVPTYYAWFEFYPHLSYTINSFPIAPGDVISAEVSADARGRFTVTLTNGSTGATFSTSAKMPSAKRSSAEWIAEAPSSGGITPLADFGTVDFNSDTATVAGTTAPIASFGSNVFEIQMVSKNGVPEASPSSLSGKGSSFSVAWQSSGQ